MARKVFLAGLKPDLMDRFRARLDLPDVELFIGTGVDEIRAVLAAEEIDHVILGGGLSLETRLEMIRTVYESSDRATLHMKDHRSGPEGFVPFVRAVLGGLREYQPTDSDNAILRARRT
jgi:hypothetical protein